MIRRVVVFGGRFNASEAEFVHAVDYCFTDPDVLATDVLMTEVSPDRFQGIVKRYVKTHRTPSGRKIHAWRPRRKGANECVIFSDRRLRRKGAEQLTKLHIKVGRTAPIHLIYAKVFGGPWWSIWHTAAHNFGLRKGVFATLIYHSTLPGWRGWLRRRSQAKHGAGSGGDFNLGLDRAQIQDLLLEGAHGYRFTEKVGGGREIIGIATNMEIVEFARRLKMLAGFDHPPVLSVLRSPVGRLRRVVARVRRTT